MMIVHFTSLLKKGKTLCLRGLSFLIIICFAFSCDSNSSKNDSGTIKYRITYLKNGMTTVNTSFLPKAMKVTYNKRYIRNTIEGVMGMFSIIIINDMKEETSTIYLKFLGNRYSNTCDDKTRSLSIFADMPTIKLKNTDTYDTIAGYKARLVKAHEENNGKVFDVYYTDDIRLRKPNRYTPYHKIHGILMGFELEMAQMRMSLLAEEATSEPIPNEEFEMTEAYKPVSDKNMNKILTEILTR